MSFLEKLIEKNVVSKKQADSYEAKAKGSQRSLEDALVEGGLKEEDILTAKGEYFGVPIKEVGSQDVPFELLKYVPEESASHYQFVPIGVKDGVLEVGIIDPENTHL